jgi:hypothetical protein
LDYEICPENGARDQIGKWEESAGDGEKYV